MSFDPSGVEVVRQPDRAAILLDPVRRRLVEMLAQPNSASGLARRLGEPRQRVNYHLRQLEKAGLVELVEERRRRNCVERVVRATARSYLISSEALGDLGNPPESLRDRLSASYLVSVAARLIRELAVLTERARAAGRRLATFSLTTDIRFRSAEERNQFAEELATSLARLASKYHDERAEGARTFRVVAGVYPALDLTADPGAPDPEPEEPPDA